MSQTIRSLAAAEPGAEAILEGDRTLTRAELDRRIDQLAHLLASAGVATGERVAWIMHNRAEVAVLAFAVQRLGAVIVPLSYRSTGPELKRLLSVARPTVVVAEAATRAALEDVHWPYVVDVDDPAFTQALHAAPKSPVVPPSDAAERLGAGASMLFTSGTTGAPKATVRTKGDQRLGEAIAERLGFHPNTRYLASGPLYHSGPGTCALMALSRGGVVALRPSLEPSNWLAFARRCQITATFVTPTQLRRLVHEVEAGTDPPHSLTNVVVSGEPFPAELKRRAVQAFGPHVIECYGCTELGPLTYMAADRLLTRPESSGRAFPGVEIAAFDGDRRLPPSVTGLLRVRTPLAFEGYLDPTSWSPDRPEAEWATAGDVGFVDADGYAYLVGRVDDLIISGGVNVFPADVEAVLIEHPEVHQCAVVGLPDAEWGQVVCAAVVAERALPIEEVREWMRGRIADDKRPHRVVQVPSLPTTHTEKVSRRALRQMLQVRGYANSRTITMPS